LIIKLIKFIVCQHQALLLIVLGEIILKIDLTNSFKEADFFHFNEVWLNSVFKNIHIFIMNLRTQHLNIQWCVFWFA